MTRDQLRSAVQPLRKAAIGEPIWSEQKRVFEYLEHSAKVVAILKIARATQGIAALDLLCQHGLFIDMGAIIRCVNDCTSEVYFLLEEYPQTSTHVDQFVKAFFESSIDGYLSTETPTVPTKKIRSAVVRTLKKRHDEQTSIIIQNIYKTFSGYVHANYAHIMEVYGGVPATFNLNGVPSRNQIMMRMEAVDLSANSVLHAATFAAQKLELTTLCRELVENL